MFKKSVSSGPLWEVCVRLVTPVVSGPTIGQTVSLPSVLHRPPQVPVPPPEEYSFGSTYVIVGLTTLKYRRRGLLGTPSGRPPLRVCLYRKTPPDR